MRRSSSVQQRLFVCVVGTVVCAAALHCRAAQPQKTPLPKEQTRLAAMQAAGSEASLTLFPVVLWDTRKPKDLGDIGKDVANVVGLMLEQSGMGNLETSESDFLLPADVDFDQAAVLFGKHVRDNPIKTDYALYGEFIGRKGAGGPRFDEVRAVMVDKAGKSVWLDRQIPESSEFKRIKPDCPMECCVLLTQRLRGVLGLPENAGKDTSEGKFARLWARESALPDKAEQAAIEQRLEAMKQAGPDVKMLVYPVLLPGNEVSAEGAKHLAGLLNDRGLCQADVRHDPLVIELQRTHNEQKALWDMAREFREHVRLNPPDADYALYADYMISLRDNHVMSVHFVVCDRTGEWVIVDFQNNHHGDFQSVNPKTVDACGSLAARRLEGYLR